MSAVATTAATAPTCSRPRLGRWVDLVTIALGTWLLVGVFVDGWAHNNLRELETFFTPWHALLYSGFVAVGAWIMWRLRPAVHHGRLDRAAVPLGYGLGAVGVGVFAVGGVADLAWHEVFGIEQDIQALFSPTHLTLFLGIVLIMSTPLRAAWADPRHDSEPRYGQFVQVIWSATMTAAMTAFFFMYWAAFNHTDATRAAMTVAADRHLTGFYIQNVLASILVTTVVLLAPLLLLARRRRLPLGTATTVFAVVGILTNALSAFRNPALILAAVLAGLASDAVVALLRPGAHRPRQFWATGAVIPLVTWMIYYGVLVATAGVGLAAPVWTGSILWAALAGATLALLMVPPAAPVVDPTQPALRRADALVELTCRGVEVRSRRRPAVIAEGMPAVDPLHHLHGYRHVIATEQVRVLGRHPTHCRQHLFPLSVRQHRDVRTSDVVRHGPN